MSGNTAQKWTEGEKIRYLSDSMYPGAEKTVPVMDNLNTQTCFPLQKISTSRSRTHYKRLEIHYTPKHKSRLDVAEIELKVMTRQCMTRCIDNLATLRVELTAWETERNYPLQRRTGISEPETQGLSYAFYTQHLLSLYNLGR